MKKDYDIADALAAIEDELIDSMIRNMKRHRLEEDAEDKQWEMWQALQLKSLEEYKKKNKEKFTSWFSNINDQIEEVIKEANKTGLMDQELEILDAIKKGFKGYKRSSSTMQAEFFGLNERKLEALIKATTDDMKKVETAILRMANDQYRKVIFNAQVYANTGAGTYEKAADMATKDMLSAGLNCVEYVNGARHTLKDYADMAIRTASKRAYLQGEGTKRKEWGIPTVIMNKRGNPCPKCLPFCGKVLIDDVWSGGSENGVSPVTGEKYQLMSKAIAAGLYHPRCKDSHTTYFEGISTPPDLKYSKKELSEISEEYQKEQKQQYTKRQVEKFARLSKHSLDQENKTKYELKKQEWESKIDKENMMKISLPDEVYKISGMTDEIKEQIEQAIADLQKEYSIKLDYVEVGPMGKGDLFGAGPYLDRRGKLRFGLVLNENIDYNKVKKLIKHRYEIGRFAGKSLADYIAHEMAHIMTYQDCNNEKEYQARKKIISKQFIAGISQYADKTQNGEESLAEAFVRYRNGEKIPINAIILVRTYIERWRK